ncbi:hypothetical protein BDZ94DRAFT_1367942 [Collybia nuda]|uniref:Annexin n=1 Tax=Collybia nuda TaxID=64659 RepID=A0A9P5Y4U7_9AGAR|nr:hypothetical protein BDZ94DRAFT_1367942 [Collybia nuda]
MAYQHQQTGGPPPVNASSYPGYGPPPPIPPNHPTAGYQGGYAPPQGGYTAPPGQYPGSYAPPHGPPAGQSPYPPTPLYDAPQTYPDYPPAPQFQGPPQGYYPPPQAPLWYLGSPIPDPFAPPAQYGVQKVPGYDPISDCEAIRKATKGFGTNDSMLITTLIPLSALKMDALAECFMSRVGKKLSTVIESETSSYFRMGLMGLVAGPLGWDVDLAYQALAGVGTNEALLTEIILGRPSSEVRLLANAYRHKYKRDLEDMIRGDLSGKTERMFVMALNANRPLDNMPVNQAEVARDVETLYRAGQAKLGTDEMAFCDILINRSQAHIAAVIGMYGNKHRSLSKVIKSEFSGHMRAGLLYIVEGAKPKRDGQGIWRDAKLIDQAMVGLGTKDKQLVWRIVRAQWDPRRMEAIKEAYLSRTKKKLDIRVASETSGSYKKLMVALVNSAAVKK